MLLHTIKNAPELAHTRQKDLMLQKKRTVLEEYSKEFIQELKSLHINFDKTQIYPRSKKYKTMRYKVQTLLEVGLVIECNVSVNNTNYEYELVFSCNNTIVSLFRDNELHSVLYENYSNYKECL